MAGNRKATGLNVHTVQEATNLISQRKIIRVTPTLSTSTYADGDVLFILTEIPNAVLVPGGCSALTHMWVADYKDVSDTDAILLFTEKNTTTIGTINATANISAANLKANNLIGWASWDQSAANTSSDIDDMRFHRVMSASGASEPHTPLMILQAAAGSTSVYVGGILNSATTPDYDAESIELIFHIDY